MGWKLFLDDDRYPPQDRVENNWRIARNVDDAIYYIKTYGRPDSMSLDHDLGFMKLDGKDFCNWLVNWCMDTGFTIPMYYIHSQNPVGVENMRSILHGFTRFSQDQQALENHHSGKSKPVE